jgi:hypothetical protein
VGVDPDIAEFPEVGANTSLGITAIDVLRRVNKELRGGKDNPPLLRRTVKQSLVNGALRQDRSPRVATPESLLPRLTEITDGWAKRIEAAGYDVVGDLADLTPRPAEGAPAEHRVPVRQSRDLAVQAVAVLTREVATLRAEVQEVERLRKRVAELESRSDRAGSVVRRIRARLRND